ncbi:MAG: hypothetical protein R2828_27925 [Saprospiraceae bacterium]
MHILEKGNRYYLKNLGLMSVKNTDISHAHTPMQVFFTCNTPTPPQPRGLGLGWLGEMSVKNTDISHRHQLRLKILEPANTS